ncbi:MAG: glutathione S-transferase family protein [Hoeflea sp.]|uniref:glutathione S-transferase family protein n=1 Tax=Hoeflea sp. TaxID=1940281 RepID=UPI001E121205|nr:glutathione S-transferase family protein [Hoeflea sp.]MBU4530737.1 glutathione S-transferase family protein [Alphaproteobacteria bacterium]MBU4544736.1 glutathione S-transferase family protein [Alphaproteobacteria bacterium]MBU4549292.1 glutathione S-transferase family protein [Alphaproteobacteria bacterium]MBV1726331.1 glutathione S-transferase family protein [Hoeflea sp.]MBV1761673.1 glutathione S-transferase family protein [Hoeflea sp.]
MTLHLMSHALCPYVQRAAISLTEKGVAFERTTIDLANKPEWFLAISPLGKTPVLSVKDQSIFESAVILEYLEETQPTPLHPADPMTRAQHRGWIEFGSAILNDIAGFYAAKDATVFAEKISSLSAKFSRLEEQLEDGPYFAGDRFSLVDAVFGPVFRYFDTFDQIGDFGILPVNGKVQSWRLALAKRPSVRDAVSQSYPELLQTFLLNRKSHLSRIMAGANDAMNTSRM